MHTYDSHARDIAWCSGVAREGQGARGQGGMPLHIVAEEKINVKIPLKISKNQKSAYKISLNNSIPIYFFTTIKTFS